MAEVRMSLPGILLPDPEALADVPVDDLPAIIMHLTALQGAAAIRLYRTPAPALQRHATSEPDRLLTAEDVHRQTQLSVRWLYRHADTLPFTRRIGRKVLFSSAGLAKWLAGRRP
jgi:predicted DNA-binding transcriptional regulator AlpA